MDVTDLTRMILALPKEDREHIQAQLALDAAGHPDAMDTLDLPMQDGNDAKAATIRGYLKALLREVWTEQEGFSGKRPFGNSGWDGELTYALVKAGRVPGEIDDEGFLQQGDHKAAHLIILNAIDRL